MDILGIGRLQAFFGKDYGLPLVVAFLVTFILSVMLLSLGYSDLGYNMGVLAYGLLLAGVILQLAHYLKHRAKSNEIPKTGRENLLIIVGATRDVTAKPLCRRQLLGCADKRA